jgi:hypothetical protein
MVYLIWVWIFCHGYLKFLNSVICEGFCYWGSEINCGVDDIWRSKWPELFWVRFLSLFVFISVIFVVPGSLLYRIVSLFYGRFFMEKQVMGEFVRILKLSKTVSVPLQLLQTVSILVQNLRNEHAICRLIILWSFLYIITMLMV